MEKITTIGLDLVKLVFQVHAITEDGHVAIRRPMRQSQVLEFFRQIEPCLIVIEACRSATIGPTRSANSVTPCG
jgi:transposase